MANETEAIQRKLVDPAFLIGLVNRSIRVNMVLAFAVLVFVGAKLWDISHPPQPYFIYTNANGKPYRTYPLEQPVMSDADVLNWTINSVIACYSINWRNYPSELTSASYHFTLQGWNSFSGSFIRNGNLEKIRDAKFVGDAVPMGAGVIVHEGVVGNIYTYEIQFPLQVTYANESEQNAQQLNMDVIVVRAPAVNHPDGIAIDGLRASPQ